jgi:twitching motility protein PilT
LARLDPIFERLFKEQGIELVFAAGAAAVMRTATGETPVLRQQLTAQQIAGVFAELAPEAVRPTFPAPGTTRFEYTAPAGRLAIAFERINGEVKATVRRVGVDIAPPEEEPEAELELASPAEILQEYMHGSKAKPAVPARPSLKEAASPELARPGRPIRPEPGQAVIAPPAPVVAAPAEVPVPRPASDPRAAMEQLLSLMLERKASDLHLSSDNTPMLRIDGDMRPIEGYPPLSPSRLKDLLFSIAPGKNREQWEQVKDTDFAYETPQARFRVNFFEDRKGIGSVMRQIPNTIRTAAEMGLPPAVLDLCFLNKGLVVVTGPTGSGKSTTLASMIDHVNRNRDDHIITIEDPIEFVHPNRRCLVNQREIGVHTGSFKHALRAALREDPDIVLVGEMRDLETIAIAIETAETGHLVFGTLHTNTAPSTVDRIIDQFPADRQEQIRMMLSESLKGVITQTLCKKIGGGRVAAMEILIATSPVANLIREGKTFQIPSTMQTGKSFGMQTLNDALLDLVKKKLVDPNEANAKAVQKSEMRQMLERGGFKIEAPAA